MLKTHLHMPQHLSAESVFTPCLSQFSAGVINALTKAIETRKGLCFTVNLVEECTSRLVSMSCHILSGS